MTLIKDIAVFNPENIGKNFEFEIIEYVDTSSVDNGKLTETQILELKHAPSRAKRLIQNNDILISTVRPNLKHFYFVKNCKENTVVSTGFVVIRPNNVVPRFLYYFLTTESYTEFLSAVADSHTSTYPSFPPEIIENSEITLPSQDEQKFIAETLGNIDDYLVLLEKQNKTLEKIIQTIFKSWFIDFDGITEFDDSELGQIPKGWKIRTIGELAHITSGKRPNYVSENKDSEFKIPLYGASGIMGYVNECLYEHRIILTGRVGTIGKIQYVYGKCFPSDNTLVILPKDHQYFNFVYSFLLNNDFESITGGSTQPLITQTDLKNTLCIISKEKIIQFEIITRIFFDKYFKNKLIIKNLKDLRDSLLPKLMSGEIRV